MSIASIASRVRAAIGWELNADDKIVAKSQANVRKALGMAGYALSYDEFSLRMLINGRPLDDAASLDGMAAHRGAVRVPTEPRFF
jgi:hypothetical protein